MLDDFHEHGPVLAIVDGRFLPIDELKIAPKNNVKTVQKIGGNSLDMTTTATSIDVGLRTRRRPLIRDLLNQKVFLRNRKYKIVLDNPHVTEEGATMMAEFGSTYDIEMNADSYTVKTTNESFL